MNSSIPVPPPVFEVCMPLPICTAPLTKALHEACPSVPISVLEATEHGMFIKIGDISIFCARHCPNPAHSCILVSIGTTIVPYNDEETTPQYIQRVVALITKQLNLRALKKVFESLPAPQTLHVVMEDDVIHMMFGDFTPDSTTATIKKGSLIHCGMPLRTNEHPNLALMEQLLKIIQIAPLDHISAKILGMENGFFGLHDHQGEKFFFLSNNQGVSAKLAAKDIRPWDIEAFLKEPTKNLAVIHASGTEFAGVVGYLESSTSTFANIRIGKDSISIPTGKWIYLKDILNVLGLKL